MDDERTVNFNEAAEAMEVWFYKRDRHARKLFAAVEARPELDDPNAWDGAGPTEEEREEMEILRLRKLLEEEQRD